MFSFYEFFSGGGMVRAGLGPGWRCAFANDISEMKAAAYAANWGKQELVVRDIHLLEATDIPTGRADLAWASFPCQDLSCAGGGLGIGSKHDPKKTRSGTFWPFLKLMIEKKKRRRAPRIIVLENVMGLLTTNSGTEFRAVVTALSQDLGYRVGAVVVDARHFVPQSRPRVFVIAVAKDIPVPSKVRSVGPNQWHPDLLQKCQRELLAAHHSPAPLDWVWFDLGTTPSLGTTFSNTVSDAPTDVQWNANWETMRLIGMMSEINKEKLRNAQRAGSRKVASLVLRMRPHNGANQQRTEINFDEVAACLRTPRGGGSRPRVLVVEGETVRSRLLSPREAATLMGLPDTYRLPACYEHAFRVIGDGVVVPVVSFIRDRLLEPILDHAGATKPKCTADMTSPSPRSNVRAGASRPTVCLSG